MKAVQKILLIVVFALLLVCVWVLLNPQTSLADNPWKSRNIKYNNDPSVDSTFSDSTIDTVFTVNSIGDTADSNPGNGDCDDGAGNCTLRAAIEESNALSGTDTIAFEIEGEGPHTIQPASALPVITDPVIIDGTTEPDYVDSPIVELFGNDMIDGLVVEAGNSTIRGLVINRFDDGIILKINGGNFIEGNYIGIDVGGTTEYHNTRGVYVNGSNNNTIGGTSLAKRNIISGNYGQIEIAFADNNLIQGNYIGTDVTGTEIFTHGGGIAIAEGSNNTIGGTVANAGNLISDNDKGINIHTEDNIKIQGNLIGTDKTGTIPLGNSIGIQIYVSTGIIGGTEAGARNIISGNGYGINGEVENTPIQGNYIGTDINGTTAVGNSYGLNVASALIGGTDPGSGNLISGNDSDGIILKWDNIVKGNIIGLDASGTIVLSNGGNGFWVRYDNNLIGGPEPGAGNVISGNQLNGIDIKRHGNIIQGNYIGTDITGEVIIGNSQYGIGIGGSNNLVGGSTIEHGNTIKGHGGGGIEISDINNGIRANSIFGNGLGYHIYCDKLGINLGCGVTLNDPGDTDEGANHLQNFPVLIPSIEPSTLFSGTLNSTSNTTFTLDFFSNSSCDPSQYGQGEHYLGSIEVTTDGAGNANFQIEELDVYPKGAFITATATDPENNTSEFSKCIILNSVYLPVIAKH